MIPFRPGPVTSRGPAESPVPSEATTRRRLRKPLGSRPAGRRLRHKAARAGRDRGLLRGLGIPGERREIRAHLRRTGRAVALQRDPARRDRGRRGRWGRREPGLRPARLEDRVSAVRGSIRVETRAAGGTRVLAEIPCDTLNRPADGDPAATPGAAACDHLTARPRTPGIGVTFRKGGSSRLAALVRTVGAGGVGALGATFRGPRAARTFRGAARYRGCDR